MTIERLTEHPSIKRMTSIVLAIQQRNAKQGNKMHANPEAAHFHSWLNEQLKILEEELRILEQAQTTGHRPDLPGAFHDPLGKRRDLLNRDSFLRDRRKDNY